ncbi:16S rRNA (cytosine(1402)-N(4))-methyltransferase RsmH [Bacteroidota bacterium]
MNIHEPVLLNETIELLVNKKSGNYFDATLGFGGHADRIINLLSSDSKYVATDKDANAFNFCVEKFKDNETVKLYNCSFTNIDVISKIEFIDGYDGILADLGVSSFQLDESDSGFTYRKDAPLDLRMDKKTGIPASTIVNKFKEAELADIIYQFGEEKKSRQIARRITERRKIKKISSTLDLTAIIEEYVPAPYVKKTLSRVFQALRIYVNNEFAELEEFLVKAVRLLKPGGIIIIISFHSLEDRIVKEFFKKESLSCICPPEVPVCICDKEQSLEILNKKPIIPSEEEVKSNKRSRSAKLRAAKKL